MKHLDESELSALLDGALEDRARIEAETHLAGCALCRESLAALEAQDHALVRMLKHDPGAAYFETFAARVQDRIRTEGVAMDPMPAATDAPAEDERPARRILSTVPPESMLERLGRWFTGPRLAWAGAAVAVIVGAGVVFMVGNEQPMRTLEDRTLAARTKQVEEQTAPPAATTRAPGSPASPTLGATESATPRDERAQAQSRTFAAPPVAATDARKSAQAQEEIASTLEPEASSAAGSPTTAPTSSGAAAKTESGTLPGRSRQVRRENGEEVPVPGPGNAPAAGMAKSTSPPNRTADNVSRAQRIKEQARTIAGGVLDATQKTRETSQFASPGNKGLGWNSPNAVRVCGTVRDASGRAIEGARVAFADLGSSTTTDASGNWCLETPAGEHTATVMAVGFREVRRSFDVALGAGNQDFTLAAVSVLGNAPRESDAADPAWPPGARTLAMTAERASRDADRRNTAGAHDSAATRWQRVSEVVKIGPASIRARQRLADARYRAWQLDPSPARADLAMAALSSYLGVAPSGAERERAQNRMEQLQRR